MYRQSIRKEKPMTIMVAMREGGDSIVIASDSEFMHEGGATTHHRKLMCVEGKPVIWTSAGNPDIGMNEFGQWISQYQ